MAVQKITRFGIQRKIVANMTTESWQNIPHVCYVYEPDVTDFMAEFRAYKEKNPQKKVTFNTVILKGISEAIKADLILNSHLRFDRHVVRGKLTTYDTIDISVPWSLPNGDMMTITMKDMGNRSLDDMAKYTDDINRRLVNTELSEALFSVSFRDTIQKVKRGHILKAVQRIYGAKVSPYHRVSTLKGKAKKEYNKIPDEDKITYEDLKQGTITVSNVGAASRGISGFLEVLMIIPPQICAIGLSAVQKKPVVVTDENGEDKIEIRQTLPICICFDHRALDFGDLQPFLRKLDEIFQNPKLILE